MKRGLSFAPYLILLLGFVLRLYRLGANSLWYDETVSVVLAQSDLAELLRHTAGDIHPPFYYFLLHFWGRLAGWSEFSAAFLSLWFGVLLIAVVYRVAREWFPSDRSRKRGGMPSVALVAAFLVAISAFNVWYSQEVRMYTLGATLGLLSVYFLRRMLAQPKILSRDFAAYVVFTVVGFYTLYYFIFLMVFEWLWFIYRVLNNRNQQSQITIQKSIISFLLSQLALLVLYLPWLPTAFRQATDPPVPPWREFIALPRMVLESLAALAFGQAVDANIFGIVALLLFIPMGIVLWQARPRAKDASIEAVGNSGSGVSTSPPLDQVSPWFLLGYTFIPLTAIYLFSLWKPLYHVRYLYIYSPAFYILVAYTLVTLLRAFVQERDAAPRRTEYGAGVMALVLGVVLLLVTGYSLNNFWHGEQFAEDDLRGAVGYIAERWRPGDAILVNAGYAYPALVYYSPYALARERLVNYQPSTTDDPLLLQTGSIGGASSLGWGDPQSDFFATSADETRAALERVFANHPRVWVLRIYDTVVDPDGVIRKYFDEHATLLDDRAFSGESQTRVQGFLTQPMRELPSDAARTNKNLGDRVELVGYEPGTPSLAGGEYLDVVLYWKLLQMVNHNYQVSLQLLNSAGENVAQTDETPLSDVLPMTRWQVSPAEGGDVLYREPLRLQIPPSLPPGGYRAIVKLYDPRSGEVLGGVIDLGGVQIR